MKKLLLVPALIALSATSACSRGTDTAVNSASSAQAASVEVELIEGGFSTGSPGLHHNNIVAFGQSRAQVIAQLQSALGAPTIGRNTDCPTGAVDTVTFGDLTLNFDRSGFAGWVLHGPNPSLETYHGLKIGLVRSEFPEEIDVLAQEDGTLGPEITASGIGALLDVEGPNGRVKTLFTGISCFAR